MPASRALLASVESASELRAVQPPRANVKHENRVNRQEIAALERVIEEQQAEIAQLVTQLAECEDGAPAEPARPRMPRIY